MLERHQQSVVAAVGTLLAAQVQSSPQSGGLIQSHWPNHPKAGPASHTNTQLEPLFSVLTGETSTMEETMETSIQVRKGGEGGDPAHSQKVGVTF